MHQRHPECYDQGHCRGVPVEQLDSLLAVFGQQGKVTLLLQQALEQHPDDFLVVYDQNGLPATHFRRFNSHLGEMKSQPPQGIKL